MSSARRQCVAQRVARRWAPRHLLPFPDDDLHWMLVPGQRDVDRVLDRNGAPWALCCAYGAPNPATRGTVGLLSPLEWRRMDLPPLPPVDCKPEESRAYMIAMGLDVTNIA